MRYAASGALTMTDAAVEVLVALILSVGAVCCDLVVLHSDGEVRADPGLDWDPLDPIFLPRMFRWYRM